MKGRAWCAHPNGFFTLMKKIMNILQFSHSDKEKKKHNNKKTAHNSGKTKIGRRKTKKKSVAK